MCAPGIGIDFEKIMGDFFFLLTIPSKSTNQNAQTLTRIFIIILQKKYYVIFKTSNIHFNVLGKYEVSVSKSNTVWEYVYLIAK